MSLRVEDAEALPFGRELLLVLVEAHEHVFSVGREPPLQRADLVSHARDLVERDTRHHVVRELAVVERALEGCSREERRRAMVAIEDDVGAGIALAARLTPEGGEDDERNETAGP